MSDQAVAAIKAVLLGEACVAWLIMLLWPSMQNFGQHGHNTKPDAQAHQKAEENIRQDVAE